MCTLLKQHLNTHKQQLRTLGLQIIIHHTLFAGCETAQPSKQDGLLNQKRAVGRRLNDTKQSTIAATMFMNYFLSAKPV
jgi:hypothetical protein